MTVSLFLGWVLVLSQFDSAVTIVPMKDEKACVAAMSNLHDASGIYRERSMTCINTQTGEIRRLK